MTQGQTSTGFLFEFDPQRANDMHVLKHVRALIDPKATPLDRTSSLVDLPVMLLGREQTDALYAHLEKLHDGRVPPAELERELTEIMQGGGEPTKN